MSAVETIAELSGENAALRHFAGEMLAFLKDARDGDTSMLAYRVDYCKRTARELGIACAERTVNV